MALVASTLVDLVKNLRAFAGILVVSDTMTLFSLFRSLIQLVILNASPYTRRLFAGHRGFPITANILFVL